MRHRFRQRWRAPLELRWRSNGTALAACRAIYLINGDDAEFNLPLMMTDELKRELKGKYDNVHAVGARRMSLRSQMMYASLQRLLPSCLQYAAAMADEGKAKLDARFRKGSSRYRGVSWYKGTGSWQMRAKLGGKRVAEYYKTEQDAARRYDHIQIQLHGRCACWDSCWLSCYDFAPAMTRLLTPATCLALQRRTYQLSPR